MAATVSTLPAASDALAKKLDELPPRVLFFDGICSFCDSTILWLTERDPDARLHFAPLQGRTADIVRAAFPERFPVDIDTIVYLQAGDGPGGRQISLRSAAAFDVCEEIGGPWKWLARMRWLPRPLMDLAYRAFAGNRYRMFGQLDACNIPTPEERARLLP